MGFCIYRGDNGHHLHRVSDDGEVTSGVLGTISRDVLSGQLHDRLEIPTDALHYFLAVAEGRVVPEWERESDRWEIAHFPSNYVDVVNGWFQ